MKHLKSLPDYYSYLQGTFKFDSLKWAMYGFRIDFGQQPLELWMFVPCDDEGNVLDSAYSYKSCGKGFVYGEARERVLFEGFTYDGFGYVECKNISLLIETLQNKTIEDLVFHNIELTETAKKKLRL